MSSYWKRYKKARNKVEKWKRRMEKAESAVAYRLARAKAAKWHEKSTILYEEWTRL